MHPTPWITREGQGAQRLAAPLPNGAIPMASDVVERLVKRNPQIALIHLIVIPDKVTDDGLHSTRKQIPVSINAAALAARKTCGTPFWMAIMAQVGRSADRLPKSVLSAASYHRDIEKFTRLNITADQASASTLNQIASELPPASSLALSSRVDLEDGSSAHIPMLDLRISSSDSAIETIQEIFRDILSVSGSLLHSGRSFHFYGNDLVSHEQLVKFLGRSLLYTPIVDHRWIAHQMIEGACALRIGAKTDGPAPHLVRDWS